MPNYTAPGVYIEEIPGTRPIEGAATAVGGFVGVAAAGDFDKAIQVTSWRQFVETFGVKQQVGRGLVMSNPYIQGWNLAHSVRGFFENGGGRAYVVRVPSGGGADAEGETEAPLPALVAASVGGLRVTAIDSRQSEGLVLEVTPPDDETNEGAFGLRLRQGDDVVEEYGDVRLGANDAALEEAGLADAATTVNESSALVRVELVGATVPPAGTYDLAPSSAASSPPALVDDAIGADLDPAAFVGDPAQRSGSYALAAIDEITMVLIPDLVAAGAGFASDMVQSAQRDLIAACADLGDRMFIVDPPAGLDAQQIGEWRGAAGFDDAFGALYYPWLVVMDPSATGAGPRTIAVPPSGHLAGVWARVDGERGVHKAPANEQVRGVVALERQTTRREQESLNPDGINCIRQFTGSGIRVWGARTLASTDTEWRYLNVRRYFNYIEDSILNATQWVVFEANDEKLWSRMRRSVTSFLLREWQRGALFGATPDEAFFVACDETTNPDTTTGEVICEIGVAVVRPAEFVIFRFSQSPMGSAVAE